MKSIITWLIIFVLGFIVGAGVGFKVLEWISGDLLIQAWDNSYSQFQKAYPWSTAQQQIDSKMNEQKAIIAEQIKNWFKDYILWYLKFSSTWEVVK